MTTTIDVKRSIENNNKSEYFFIQNIARSFQAAVCLPQTDATRKTLRFFVLFLL